MNSIDDFARLCPDVGVPSTAELDALWLRVIGDESAESPVGGTDGRPGAPGAPDGDPAGRTASATDQRDGEQWDDEVGVPTRRRRLAAVAAAAAIIAGVGAVVVMSTGSSDRSVVFDVGRLPDDFDTVPPVADLSTTTPTAAPVPETTPLDMVPGVTAPGSTIPGATVPLTPREAEAAAVSIELGLVGWELIAAESGGEMGNEYHFRSGDRVVDIALIPGGLTEYEQRVRAATDVAGIVELADDAQIATIGTDGFRYTAVTLGLDLEWVIEVDANPADGLDEFRDIVSAVEIRHVDGRVLNAGFDLTDGTAVSIPPDTTAARALVIGDSVALGAASKLLERGIVVDAAASRVVVTGLDAIDSILKGGRAGPTEFETVVVHLGGNGPIREQDLARMVDLLGEVPSVVVVTNAIDRDYTDGNNELLRALADTQDNVQVLDWARLAGACTGDCFWDDGYHLKPDGQRYYADLVAAVVG